MRRFIIVLFVVFIILILFLGIKEKTIIKIYYYDPRSLKLVPEEREFNFYRWEILFKKDKIAKDVISELIKGPKNDKLKTPIPSGTKILGISIKKDIAYVNFSKELKKNHPGGSLGEILTIYSIVNTLTELSFVKKVQILIDSAVIESLVGHMDISEPLERDLNILK
ncbi:MAG: GerMN domain-containing protein [Dictyoglomaceae bacterium]|nr:GerMN domain-containing protein [Dictyoglomaceae bacterium]